MWREFKRCVGTSGCSRYVRSRRRRAVVERAAAVADQLARDQSRDCRYRCRRSATCQRTRVRLRAVAVEVEVEVEVEVADEAVAVEGRART